MHVASKFRWFLAPTILQAGIAFATLPIATLILGPDDYGAFALISSITGLASVIACLGSSYLLAEVFAGKSQDQVRQLVSLLMLTSMGLSLLFTILIVVSWTSIAPHFVNLALIPIEGVMLSAISIMPVTFWAIAQDVLTLDGRANVFAKIVIGHSLISASALFLSLFYFDIGGMSLFISGFAGAMMFGLGALLSLRGYLGRPQLKLENFRIFGSVIWVTSAHLIEATYLPLERNLLAVSSGLSSLGLYTHAQQYRSITAAATKALSRSVWPTSLAEARQQESTFAQTHRYWSFTYLCLSVIGLAFATLGNAFIGLLTHGKFVGAGPYAAMGIAYLLVQNSGRPHTAFLFANGYVGPYARFSGISSLVAIICAVITIPLFGVWGAILSIFVQQIIMRVAIQYYCAKLINLPFQDGMAVFGLFVIAIAVALSRWLSDSFFANTTIFFVGLLCMASIYKLAGFRRIARQGLLF